MKPYYEDGSVTIYHGDCREVWGAAVPALGPSATLVTDPPYGYAHSSAWAGRFKDAPIANDADESLRDWALTQWNGPAIVFGSWKSTRPTGARTALVWDKGPASGMGDLSLPWKPSWEVIFVIGSGFVGARDEGVLRGHTVVTWSGRADQRQHPNEKPTSLLRALILKCPERGSVFDPFMGSGTTLRAAKDLGRKAIGIEIEERYCEIAAKRLSQETLGLSA